MLTDYVSQKNKRKFLPNQGLFESPESYGRYASAVQVYDGKYETRISNIMDPISVNSKIKKLI